ncbi:uncharacterized protein LOC132550796 [Ylistrum balloti]|uniref:uncharacterized protein LOC132550796 n=1 Tax=Ylistrum balloti TaxID=509963 RepID=UPI002905C56E|nr:uncharacterized protein LOC132550796 [Ylistrum balloti]
MAEDNYFRHTYYPNSDNIPAGHLDRNPFGRSVEQRVYDDANTSETDAELRAKYEVKNILRRSVVYTGDRQTSYIKPSNQNADRSNPMSNGKVSTNNQHLYRQNKFRATMPAQNVTGDPKSSVKRLGLSRNPYGAKMYDFDDIGTRRNSDEYRQRDVESDSNDDRGRMTQYRQENDKTLKNVGSRKTKQRQDKMSEHSDGTSMFNRQIATRWSTRGADYDALSGRLSLNDNNWWLDISNGTTDTHTSDDASAKDDDEKVPWWKSIKVVFIAFFVTLFAVITVSIIFLSIPNTRLVEQAKDVSVEMSITLNETFKPEYNDFNSTEFKSFQTEFCEEVRQAYTANNSVFKDQYKSCVVTGLT